MFQSSYEFLIIFNSEVATPLTSICMCLLSGIQLNRSPSLEPESTPPPSPQQATEAPVAKNTISEGFEMIACDIEALKKLCDTFDEPPPPPKKRGRKPKAPPPRKRCEVDLHQALSALLEELEKYEASFSKLLSKAKIKIMKESMEAEPVDETGWQLCRFTESDYFSSKLHQIPKLCFGDY